MCCQVAILEHRERYLRADEARDKMQRSANFLAKAEELLEKKKKEGVGADVPDVRCVYNALVRISIMLQYCILLRHGMYGSMCSEGRRTS